MYEEQQQPTAASPVGDEESTTGATSLLTRFLKILMEHGRLQCRHWQRQWRPSGRFLTTGITGHKAHETSVGFFLPCRGLNRVALRGRRPE